MLRAFLHHGRSKASALVALALAGCGPVSHRVIEPFDAGSTVYDAGQAPLDAGASSDAGPGSAAIGFPTLRVDLPCGTDSGDLCSCALTASNTSTLTGDPDTTYNVTFRVRGVSEERLINGGVGSGPWNAGGTLPDDTSNIWQLTTSSDPTTYYLNITSNPQDVFFDSPFDYDETLQLTGGTTLTLLANSRDSQEIQNRDDPGNPIVVPGIPPAPAAYNGSFFQIDFVSATVAN